MSLIDVKEFLYARFPSLAFRELRRTEDDENNIVFWTAKVHDPLTGDRGWVYILEHWPEGTTIDWD